MGLDNGIIVKNDNLPVEDIDEDLISVAKSVVENVEKYMEEMGFEPIEDFRGKAVIF